MADAQKGTQPVNYSSELADLPAGEKSYNQWFIVKLVSIAAIGGFLFGYDTGVISGAQLYFVDDWPDITDSQRSLIVSLALIGAAIGSLFSGTASDKFGRKPLILVADAFFTIGAVVMAVSPTIPCLMFGRVIVGIGVGMAAQVVPVYLSEVAPIEIRGKLVAFNTFMITFGQLFSVILVFLIKPNWRLMLGLAGVPSTIQFIGMLFMPESPRWLGKIGKDDITRGIMHRIY